MSDKVKFTPPAGAQLPEGIEAGKPFSLTCDFVLESDGMVCMTKFGNTEMPYEKDEHETPESKPGYDEMATNLIESRDAS